MRLIDADKLHPDCMTKDGKLAICQSQLANAPTVEAFTEEYVSGAYNEGYMCGSREAEKARPHGKWMKITKNGTIPVEYICSVCGRKIFDNYELSVPQSVYYPFCHCGADMKGGAE